MTDHSRARAEEPDPGLGPLRRLPAPLRRHRRRGAPVPGPRLNLPSHARNPQERIPSAQIPEGPLRGRTEHDHLPRPAGVAPTGDPAGRKGPVRHGRARDDLRLRDLRRPRPARDGARRPPARGGRLRRGREGRPARVRLRDDVGEPALRRRPEPALPRPGRRWLERRLGGGAHRRPRGSGARHRLGRLDPDPGRMLRRRRPQADARPRPARRLLAAGGELRHRRPARARRRGLRADAPGPRAGVRAARARVARGGRGGRRLDRARRPARPGAGRGGGRTLPAPPLRRAAARPGRDVPPLQARGGGRPPRALRRECRPLRRGRSDQGRELPARPRLRRGARGAAPATSTGSESRRPSTGSTWC